VKKPLAFAALALILTAAGAAYAGMRWHTNPKDRATERLDLLLASRESIARQRDEVRAERDAERKAWARLAVTGFAHVAEQRPDVLAEYSAARRALQALGVDVDDLLEEANR
jgi:hypothetical protein